MNKKELLIRTYLIVFGIIMLLFCFHNRPRPLAEWDDYTLPIASILNDHDFCISSDDVEVYKEIFPEWKDYISDYSLSFYMNRAGNEELTYYYPVYAINVIKLILNRLIDAVCSISARRFFIVIFYREWWIW